VVLGDSMRYIHLRKISCDHNTKLLEGIMRDDRLEPRDSGPEDAENHRTIGSRHICRELIKNSPNVQGRRNLIFEKTKPNREQEKEGWIAASLCYVIHV